MVHQKIKNIILLSMVLVCIYLSSKVWLQLPDFLDHNLEKENAENEDISKDIDMWTIVKPFKNIISYNGNYTVLYSDDYDLWNKAVYSITAAFENFSSSKISVLPVFPAEYLKFDFTDEIPVEIFTGYMNLENPDITSKIKKIKNIIVDLNNSSIIYIYNGHDTIRIENDKIDTRDIINITKNIDFSKCTKYSLDEKIGEKKIQIPVPLEQTALNPIFVQSELDVFDTKAINKIAKDYFKRNYEYVRKSVEVSGNLVYMYRADKILKINEEGLLDFYDANIDYTNVHDVYGSFISALNFTNDFLGIPKSGYLSKIEDIQHEGNYGYRFIISYKIKQRPILFSKIRENTALQIDVIGKDVVSYKRFIRNIDEAQNDKMLKIKILPVTQVIEKNINYDYNTKNQSELIPLNIDMIENISNIYLGYFDLSRISKEQVLKVVWVIEIDEKSFIFNAITGALIEEW